MQRFTLPFVLALAGSTVAVPAVDKRQQNLGGQTQNFQAGVCKGTMIIFARGTTEGGNVGRLAGPPMFQDVAQKTNNDVAVQGVEYPANIPGFLAGGDAAGSKKMAQLVQQTITQCPDSAVIVSGYSQGAQVVHNAAKQLPPDVMSKVAGVVTFGDPLNKTPAVAGVDPSKVKIFCHDGDNICEGGSRILQAHLTYGKNAGEAGSAVVKFKSAKARPVATTPEATAPAF